MFSYRAGVLMNVETHQNVIERRDWARLHGHPTWKVVLHLCRKPYGKIGDFAEIYDCRNIV